MALMNRRLSHKLEVAFLMPSQQYTYLNATLVKEVARLGGSVKGLVPPGVEKLLLARVKSERAAAVAGGMVPGGRRGGGRVQRGGRRAGGAG
jgi:hypothetical protein